MTTRHVHSAVGLTPGTGADRSVAVIDNVAPSDINFGDDPLSPLESLDEGLFFNFNNGEIAKIGGVQRPKLPVDYDALFHQNDLSGRTWIQWVGKEQSHIRPMVKCGTTGWSTVSNGFVKDVAAISTNAIVAADAVMDYDSPAKIDAKGRRWSHSAIYPADVTSDATTIATMLALARGAQGKVYVGYRELKGRVAYLPPNAGPSANQSPAAPSANGLEVILGGKSGIAITASGGASNTINPNNTIYGLKFGCAGDDRFSSLPGAIYFQSGDNCLTEACEGDDSRKHFVSHGSRVTNDTIRNCTNRGLSEASYAYVFNATGVTSGQPNKVTNCFGDGLVSYCNSLLGDDGKYVARGFAIGSYYAHGGILSLEWRNCRHIGYSQPGGGAADISITFVTADESTSYAIPPTAPSDVYDPETYQAKYRQTIPSNLMVENECFLPDQGIWSYEAWINGRLHYDQLGAVSNGRAHDYSSRKGTVILYGMEFVVNMNNAGRDLAFLGIGPNVRVICVGCSFYDYSLTHGAFKYGIAEFTATTKNITSIGTGANPIFRMATAHGLVVGSRFRPQNSDAVPNVNNTEFTIAAISNDGTFTDTPDSNATYLRVVSPPTISGAGTAVGTIRGLGKLECYGCRFVFRDTAGGGSRKLIFGDGGVEYDVHSHLVWQDNSCYNVTSFSDNGNFSAEAGFRSLVDTGIIVETVFPYLLATGVDLTITEAAKNIKFANTVKHIRLGVDQAPWAGITGCYQLMGQPTSNPAKLSVRRALPAPSVMRVVRPGNLPVRRTRAINARSSR